MSIVTIVGPRFLPSWKERVWAGGRAPRVRPRPVSRREMRQFLVDTLDDLAGAPCQFWACPGPDKPTKAMMTCNSCYRLKRIRVMIGWLS